MSWLRCSNNQRQENGGEKGDETVRDGDWMHHWCPHGAMVVRLYSVMLHD